MKSKLLSFLLVIACAALIGLRPVGAQNPTSTNDSNGSAVAAPAQHSDASHSAVSPSSAPAADRTSADAQRDANNAVANDRGTVTTPQRPNTSSGFNVGWIGLLGLLGLLGLVRRGSARSSADTNTSRDVERRDYPRAA